MAAISKSSRPACVIRRSWRSTITAICSPWTTTRTPAISARFLYIVQGGDYGWRMGYQYETAMHDETVRQGNRGPYNYEQLWKPDTQAAYLVPAIRNFSNGPSGFTAYPGVGLSDRYKGHFFLANFSGSPGNSGIFSFATKPKGASFEMVDDHKFMWNILATDCEFGPDGAFYVSDWVDGWNLPNKGRIYKVTDPKAMKNPAVAEAKKLIAEGMQKRSIEELLKLLGHPQRQVRMEAQFALAAMGGEASAGLTRSPRPTGKPLCTIHAISGVENDWPQQYKWQVAIASNFIVPLLSKIQIRKIRAQDLEVFITAAQNEPTRNANYSSQGSRPSRANVRRLFGFARFRAETRPLPKTAPSHEGVRETHYFKCFATIQRPGCIPAAMPESIALAQVIPAQSLIEGRQDKSPPSALRLVVALRRQKAPEVAAFLNDTDPNIVAEAARAINDVPIPEAMPKLADLITRPDLPRMIAYRVLNAHFLARQAGERPRDCFVMRHGRMCPMPCDPWPCGCSANGRSRRGAITSLG